LHPSLNGCNDSQRTMFETRLLRAEDVVGERRTERGRGVPKSNSCQVGGRGETQVKVAGCEEFQK